LNEIKLSTDAPFTNRQNGFLADLRSGKVEFELNNKKFNTDQFGNIPKGEFIHIRATIKTVGDGTVNGPVSFLKYNPIVDTWE
jgi:hypothetical protein